MQSEDKYYIEHSSAAFWLVRSKQTNMCRIENINTKKCTEWFSDENKVRQILDHPQIMEFITLDHDI
jgi:hypothetical protein